MSIEQIVNKFVGNLDVIIRAEIARQIDGALGKKSVLRGKKSRVEKPYKRGKPKKENRRPSPITGALNHYRRYSYLEPEHRTKENLARFKGWIHESKEDQVSMGVHPVAVRIVNRKRRKS